MTESQRNSMALRLGLLIVLTAVVVLPGWSRTAGGLAAPNGTDAAAQGSALVLETGALRDTPSRIIGGEYDRLGDRRPSSTPLALAVLTGCVVGLLSGVLVRTGLTVRGLRSKHPSAAGPRAPPPLPSV